MAPKERPLGAVDEALVDGGLAPPEVEDHGQASLVQTSHATVVKEGRDDFVRMQDRHTEHHPAAPHPFKGVRGERRTDDLLEEAEFFVRRRLGIGGTLDLEARKVDAFLILREHMEREETDGTTQRN